MILDEETLSMIGGRFYETNEFRYSSRHKDIQVHNGKARSGTSMMHKAC